MSLNKSTGNMYDWVDYTFNMIKGKCPHDCTYCYMKKFKQNPVRFDEKEFKTDLGSGNTIFVGSSCDCLADALPEEWISKMLEHLRKYPDNTYLIQTKNPIAFNSWSGELPPGVIFGTTTETNRSTNELSKAPDTFQRYLWMKSITRIKHVSIEPVMDFDLNDFTEWIRDINPRFVSIGADSKGHKLPEPSPEKLNKLIANLKQFTEVKIKPNLMRLINNA